MFLIAAFVPVPHSLSHTEPVIRQDPGSTKNLVQRILSRLFLNSSAICLLNKPDRSAQQALTKNLLTPAQGQPGAPTNLWYRKSRGSHSLPFLLSTSNHGHSCEKLQKEAQGPRRIWFRPTLKMHKCQTLGDNILCCSTPPQLPTALQAEHNLCYAKLRVYQPILPRFLAHRHHLPKPQGAGSIVLAGLQQEECKVAGVFT